MRLALAKVAAEGGEGAPAFRERFAEDFTRFDEELKLFRQTLGDDIVDWLDSRWGALLKAVYSKKKIPMFVDDEEVGTFLYDEGLKFGTTVPDHGEVARRTGEAGRSRSSTTSRASAIRTRERSRRSGAGAAGQGLRCREKAARAVRRRACERAGSGRRSPAASHCPTRRSRPRRAPRRR